MDGVKIKNIKELRWEFCDVLYLENMEFDIKKFVSDINFDISIDKKEGIIEFFFHTRYGLKLEDDSKKVQILHSDLEVEFQVDDFNVNFDRKEEEDKNQILAILLGITISTARGIIYSHSKGHSINKLILPIINPSHLLEKKLNREKQINHST